MRTFLASVALLVAAGCTSVTTVAVPPRQQFRGAVFVTQSDLKEPYDSLGPVQVTRKGVLLFGFANPAGIDLQTAIDHDLIPEVRRLGGDGVINVTIQETQYPTVSRVIGAIFFFIPFPAECTVTGEVVRLRNEAPLQPQGGTTL